MSLEGRVALVTGAGSGIGKGAAIAIAREGATVALLGRTQEKLDKVADTIEESGGRAFSVVADISVPDEMEKAVEQIIEAEGRLDILVANAGINGVWAPIEDLTYEEWSKTIDVNLTGTFITIKSAVPYLKKEGGAIVVVSSVNGTRMFSNTGAGAYASSKAGQLALSKMLAPELAPHKVRINVICPGAIETNIGENTERRNLDKVSWPIEFPQGKIPLTGKEPGTIEETGALILFLVSDAASHITGTEMWIDGAQSLVQG